MVVWLGDFHTTQVLCGAPSETALTGALRELCAGDEGASGCDLFKVIDPAGNERMIEGVSFPGPAETPAEGGGAEPEAEPEAQDPAAGQEPPPP
jgi:hypothetical protein